ncbi:MAG TPA: lyase family protein [Micromonosporaceae bacterium]|nr:lyase family protein [Micromonosporaceae bacterium]
MYDVLIGASFTAPAVNACLDDHALLQAMLDTEAALATACAMVGLIPERAATTIGARCRAEFFDTTSIGQRTALHATPVVPLVADLRAALPEEMRGYVHLGATSQDILDTATCLIARDALQVILSYFDAVAEALAFLAERHAADVQIGRTLLQHAEPTTFGLVCAGWLTGVDDARARLARVVSERLAAQVGGPVGNRAAYGPHGPVVACHVAQLLDLADPVLPWHSDRQRTGELAAAVALAAGALATIGRNVVLLAQTELAEVAEGSAGGSSSMPHKRNPARGVQVVAGARQIAPLAAGVLAGMDGEAQRAAGTWQAELPALRRMLSLLGGAALHTRELVTGLRVDAARMRATVEARPPEQRESSPTDEATVAAARTLIDRALAAHRHVVRTLAADDGKDDGAGENG